MTYFEISDAILTATTRMAGIRQNIRSAATHLANCESGNAVDSINMLHAELVSLIGLGREISRLSNELNTALNT